MKIREVGHHCRARTNELWGELGIVSRGSHSAPGLTGNWSIKPLRRKSRAGVILVGDGIRDYRKGNPNPKNGKKIDTV